MVEVVDDWFRPKKVMLKEEMQRYRDAMHIPHGAVGNVGGAHVDWCIAEIFGAFEDSLH